jgi:type VI secretion system protein ImpF
MPRTDREPNIVPSLLDRLLDDAPEQTQEPLWTRTQTVRQLEAAVARDLEELLNCRREMIEEMSPEFAEVSRSLLNYGLPDFTSFSLSGEKDRARIRRILEETIVTFEPRLQRARVTLEPPREHEKGLRFRVDALLRVESTPQPVTFDTVWKVETREYRVQGHG